MPGHKAPETCFWKRCVLEILCHPLGHFSAFFGTHPRRVSARTQRFQKHVSGKTSFHQETFRSRLKRCKWRKPGSTKLHRLARKVGPFLQSLSLPLKHGRIWESERDDRCHASFVDACCQSSLRWRETEMRSASRADGGLAQPTSFCAMRTIFLLISLGLASVDAGKNRGWLPEGQLVRGTRPRPRTGYGSSIIPGLFVIFGGDVQGSE